MINKHTHPITPAAGYAGDIPLALAHAWWSRGDAVMVDVRSYAERDWVGYVPGVAFVPWKVYPAMQLNPEFDAQLAVAAPDKHRPLLLLCRSGVRSIGAARRAQELGYVDAYNILEGFEGDANADQRRNTKNGWRHAGYAWIQG
jgi:rhodanese-related sulfurtransferase